MVSHARKMGFPALALTDHGNIAGWMRFISACEQTEDSKGKELPYPPIKFILGEEFYLSKKMDIGQYDEKSKKQGVPKKNQPEGRKGNRHLNLYAMNYEGYQNLCTLSQKSWTDGFYSDPRIDLDLLSQYSSGLMAGSACLSSVINANLLYGRYEQAKKACGIFKDLFGENFFLEVMYHGLREQEEIIPDILKLSEEMDIPVIATNDTHFLHKEQGESHEVLMCMNSSRCILDPKRISFPYHEFYLKSADEMYSIFKGIPHVLTNSVKMADRIDCKDITDNLFGKVRLPAFSCPDKLNPYEYMSKLAWEGLKREGWEDSHDHVKALKKELADVKVAWDNNGYDFSTYFLIVRDYIEYARSIGCLVGAGRGSAYASVLLRCLGVTYGLDPLMFIWERFLAFETNAEGKRVFARASLPDIDTDFDDEKRDQVIQYLINKYGREYVGNIGNHSLLKLKSCVRRVGKTLDVAGSYHKGKDAYITDNERKVTEILSPLPKVVLKANDDKGEVRDIKTIDDAIACFPDFAFHMKQFPELEKHIRNIQGVYSQQSTHAGGVLVSSEPLEKICPLMVTRDTLATQFSGDEVERLGLIKFDILGLSTLTTIKKTFEIVKRNYNIDLDIKNIPLDDKDTFKLYREGKLTGVFQCENYGMQQTMIKIGVDRFEDIMAAIALYRPGPMDNIDDYCARKKGEVPLDYFDKSIEPFVKEHLKDTYGIIIYQEQLMQVCNSLAGFSITEGYMLIKAVGKKKLALMGSFKERFINGCVNNGISKEIATQYWEKIVVPFANYAFNRGHTGAYGFNSYLSCYLKTHYPEEFVIANLTGESERANYEKLELFEKKFQKELNIVILPKNINQCKAEYTIERKRDKSKNILKSEIRPSLMCKGLGKDTAMEIEKHQPYKNLRDFAEKTDPSIVDMRAINALAEAGFFKSKDVVEDFKKMRGDMKKLKEKGVSSEDMFA